LHTDDVGLSGYGFTFTIDRGNDICVLAANRRAQQLGGRDLDEIVGNLGGTYRTLKSDPQLRWLGPKPGVEQLAMATVLNTVRDLAARVAKKPLWRPLSDISPELLSHVTDLEYRSIVPVCPHAGGRDHTK